MSGWRTIRLWVAAMLCAGVAAGAQQAAQGMGLAGQAVLDRVVAVVNNRAILSSDVDEEMRLSVLEPRGSEPETRASALQRLISRTLIQQQIRQEDALAVEPSQKDIDGRVAELRRNLPMCVQAHCTSDAGWAAFLSAHGLTALDVQNYMRARSEILGFIENRFRAGIRVPQEDVERYYRDTLAPQYAAGAAVPPLSAVSARIEEILLQQQVSSLFSAWLDNLRKQGDVEILDPALEAEPAAGVQNK